MEYFIWLQGNARGNCPQPQKISAKLWLSQHVIWFLPIALCPQTSPGPWSLGIYLPPLCTVDAWEGKSFPAGGRAGAGWGGWGGWGLRNPSWNCLCIAPAPPGLSTQSAAPPPLCCGLFHIPWSKYFIRVGAAGKKGLETLGRVICPLGRCRYFLTTVS